MMKPFSLKAPIRRNQTNIRGVLATFIFLLVCVWSTLAHFQTLWPPIVLLFAAVALIASYFFNHDDASDDELEVSE